VVAGLPTCYKKV
jgi:hypothetical protein